MKWPWTRDPVEPEREQQEMGGAEAHREAVIGLEETQARTPEVHRVTSSLRELRERNGFYELIESAIQGAQR